MKIQSLKFFAASLAMGAMLAPASLLAAPAPAAEGSQASPASVYGARLSHRAEAVVAVAEAMPADKYGFSPASLNIKGSQYAGVRTFAQQIQHVATENYEMMSGFGIEPPLDPESIGKLTTKDQLVEALKGSFAFAHKVVGGMTAQNAFEEVGPHKRTRAGQISFMLEHDNDHYGQMVEYLRMNGIVPPASRRHGM